MDITIKTLKGDVFKLQCSESDTVSTLKTKIFESKFAFPYVHDFYRHMYPQFIHIKLYTKL